MGQGVNYVTGDYSRGAAGFWVEGGQHRATRCTRSPSPATCATCSSGIVAVGADAYTLGSKTDRLGADRADEDRRQLNASRAALSGARAADPLRVNPLGSRNAAS